KWAKRKPAIALLTAAVILLTLGGTTALIWLWQQTAAALANLKQKHYVIQQKEYVIQIAAAEHGFVNGNPYRAEETLEHCQPELRGWEWRFLKRWWQYRSDLLHGHTGMVQAVAFSPNAKVLASGGHDGIRLRDTLTGQETAVLPDGGEVVDLAFGGGLLVSAE